MELWIGPAIVAAVVSALVNVAGWFVAFRSSLRLDRIRREEKVRDYQVALRAEINSELLNLEVVDRPAFLKDIEDRYKDPAFSVLVPHLAENPVFASVVKEIHILPESVIAPVVHYARLRQAVERFVDDMRSQAFPAMAPQRQLAMFSDYLDMLDRLEALAQNAASAIDQSLNNQDAGRSSRSSVSGPGGAAAAAERYDAS